MAEQAQVLAEPGIANWRRGFWSLIATQYQGAFSDQLLRWLSAFVAGQLILSQYQRDLYVVLVIPELLALPFLIFSMSGGWLADRYSKRSVTIGTKLMEIAAMVVALVGLATKNIPLTAAAVFFVGTQAALFGPSKYGLLPELLPLRRLSWGNGVLELGTFLAILTGSIAAGQLAEMFRGRQAWSGLILIGLACLGLLTSLGISRVPARDPARHFPFNAMRELWAEMKLIRKDRILWMSVLANAYFWFLGSLVMVNLLLYGSDLLRVGERETSLLWAVVGLGIGIGSLAAGYASRGTIRNGLIPVGLAGIVAVAILLARHGISYWTVGTLTGLLGFFAGFFVVPVNAHIQHRPAPERKGQVLAAANLLSFVGVALQPVGQYAMIRLAHPDPARMFLWIAGLTLVAAILIVRVIPDPPFRLLIVMLMRCMYRIEVRGRENIPEQGGCLLVPNHVSYMDAFLLSAAVRRPSRFLIDQRFYDHPAFHWFLKLTRTIPISSDAAPRELLRSLHAAREMLLEGEQVCIFAEGEVTRIGRLLPFRPGFERVAKGTGAPIIPVYMDGIWGSIFTFERGKLFWKWPHGLRRRVRVCVGKPLAETSTPWEVREAVQQLSTEAFALRKRRMHPLHRAFVRNAHRHPFRFAMGDTRAPRMELGRTLLNAIFLARRLGPVWRGREKIGILLPPSVAGALVNVAALLCGKVAVNLNYTTSREALESCLRQCEIKTVITTKPLLERLEFRPPGDLLLLEEVAANPRVGEKIASLLLWPLPGRWLERLLSGRHPARMDDLATIIFSSGSTGEPKGVLLSHFNIAANIAQMTEVFYLDHRDCILGILPFFHSFGFTVTLWLPLTHGVRTAFHPNPMDGCAIGQLVSDYRITFLIATPTFLQAYMRRCGPAQFRTLRFVVAGAQKLPQALAEAFEERFGIAPLEGYGCTECSPVVAVNTPDWISADHHQVGTKRGTIGHPLPAISVRIVHHDTRQPLPPGESGLLLLRGPNVMQGYLGRPEETAKVLQDGWYETGDIGRTDEDGFLTITDRASRFSKIGGEMVPHVKVEEILHQLVGSAEHALVVTSVADGRKGERLVVLHTLDEEQLQGCLSRLGESGLPNLWIPRPHDFFRVDALPTLGTGKFDLRRIRDIARARSTEEKS